MNYLQNLFQWNGHEMKKIIPLAIPAVISNLTNVGMGAVDTIVAGKASGVDMASVALGGSVFWPVQLFAVGILMILGPIISNLRGKKNVSRIGYFMSNGTWIVAALSVMTVVILYFLRGIFPLITDDVRMQTIASDYIMFMLWGVPANLAYVALRSLNEGNNMTRPAMFVGIVALLVNIPANFIFVFGKLGMPQLGGAGCGLATAIVFWVQFAAMFALVYYHPKHRSYRSQLLAIRWPAVGTLKTILKLGMPVGFSMLCEVLMFCVASLIIAPLGYVAVGSLQIAGNVGGVLFMVPLSIGLAVSIRVAYYSGKKDMAGVDAAIRCGYNLSAIFIVLNMVVVLIFRQQIVQLYNDEPAIVALATGLLLLVILYQLPDNLQVVTMGILRGFRDTVSITVITFVSYWVIGFPVCVILARTDLIVPMMGPAGIMIGISVGLCAATVMLIGRVVVTRKKEIARCASDAPDDEPRGPVMLH